MLPIIPGSDEPRRAESPDDSLAVRLPIFALAGALAAIVVGMWGGAFQVAMDWWKSDLPLVTYLDLINVHRYREYVQDSFGVSLSGAIGGLLCACLSRRTRQPYVLASVWASILGTLGLALLVYHQYSPTEAVLMVASLLTSGVIFGFVTGLVARFLAKIANRVKPQG